MFLQRSLKILKRACIFEKYRKNKNKNYIICVYKIQRETYKLEAMAQDKGYPPLSRTVEVQIDVVDRANNPPVWDHTIYGPIYVKENMPVGGKVVSIKARSVSAKFYKTKTKTKIKKYKITIKAINHFA